jgi:DNA polymerase III sliding clamp (beta) subunit (PCNA family)
MLKLSKQDLQRLRETIGTVVPKKSSIDVLKYVLVQEWGDDGDADITATDLDITVKTRCGVSKAPSCTYLIPWTTLKSCKYDMTLQFINGHVEVQYAGAMQNIDVPPVEDWPIVKFEPEAEQWTLPASLLADIKRFSFCQSTDENRIALCGAAFQKSEKGLLAVMTDGICLAAIDSAFPAIDTLDMIIPRIVLGILYKMNETVHVQECKGWEAILVGGEYTSIGFRKVNELILVFFSLSSNFSTIYKRRPGICCIVG